MTDELAAGSLDACPVCSRTASWEAIPTRPDPGFSVVRCAECGYGRSFPVVGDAEIGRWYPQAYYGEDNVRFNRLFEALVRVFRKRRARWIARLSRPGPALDVGCGRGFLLRTLKDLGYGVQGVELSEHAARHARALGIDVHVGPFRSGPFVRGTYHAVIFWHSLEHLRNPFEAIAWAGELLAPGGLLVVAVPNLDSLQARLFGGDWFHLDVPRHYVHFGTRSLRRTLERAGFRPLTVSHFSLEQNPYGALQSLYNVLGFDWNLLYALLKTRSSRPDGFRPPRLQTALVVLLFPWLFALALGIWLVELVLRRGGTIDVYAEKV